MQAIDLLEAIGEVDDGFIAEADAAAIKRKRSLKKRRTAIIGAVVLTAAIIAGIIAGIAYGKNSNGPSSAHPVSGFADQERPELPDNKNGTEIPDGEEPGDNAQETAHEHDYALEGYYAGNCREEGWQQYTCTICGDTYRVSTGYGPHSFVTDILPDGHYTTCTICGETSFTPHSYVNGECSCGYEAGSVG